MVLLLVGFIAFFFFKQVRFRRVSLLCHITYLDDVNSRDEAGKRHEYMCYLNDKCFEPPHLATPAHPYAGIGQICAFHESHMVSGRR